MKKLFTLLFTLLLFLTGFAQVKPFDRVKIREKLFIPKPIGDNEAVDFGTLKDSLLIVNLAIELNTIHRTSDGSDHGFLDQNVTTTSSPLFNAAKLGQLIVEQAGSPSILFKQGAGLRATLWFEDTKQAFEIFSSSYPLYLQRVGFQPTIIGGILTIEDNVTILSNGEGKGITIKGSGINSPLLDFNDVDSIKVSIGLALSAGHFSTLSQHGDMVIRVLDTTQRMIFSVFNNSEFIWTTAPLGSGVIDVEKMRLSNAGDLLVQGKIESLDDITALGDITKEGTSVINTKELQSSLVYSSYNFDGTNDYISTLRIADLWQTANTIHIKVYIIDGQPSSNQYLLAAGVGQIRTNISIASDGRVLAAFTSDNSNKLEIETLVSTLEDGDNGLIDIIITHNSDYSNGTVYINGIDKTNISLETGTVNKAAFIQASIEAPFIGARNSNTVADAFFSGQIFKVGIYNREYTAQEAEILSQGGNEQFCDIGASQTDLTSGTLKIGKRYILTDWITNDDFTNVGAASNADGIEFIATGTTPNTWTNSSVVNQIGSIIEYNESGIGHNTWMGESINDFYGTVHNATYINIPSSDNEEARQNGITTDTQILSSSNIIPDGYMLKYVIGTETAGNTGTLDLGTTAGTSNVFSQVVFTASSTTSEAVDFINLTGSDLPLYINDDGAGTWNSSNINFIFILQKIR